MAKQYEVTSSIRNFNRFTSWMARRGIGRAEVLTTVGRKSGQSHSVPVSPIEIEGVEYVVSPYGQVSWVHNARANPMVSLRRGSKERSVRLEETTEAGGAPAVAAYHARESFARPFMDVPEDPTLDDFVNAADRFPVFKVISTT